MSWDTNWATSKATGKLPLNALTQLRAALAERAGALPSSPTLPAAPAAGQLPATWFGTFQAAMSALFAYFADHTQYAGNYDGQTAVPVWNEASITAACDVTSRIAAPTTGTIITPWAWQQYQMINLLRWVYERNPGATDAYQRYGATVADWNAASWNATGYTFYGAMSIHFSTIPAYTYNNYVMKYTAPVYGSTQASGDLYLIPIKQVNYWTDLGWAENVLNKVETVAEAASILTSGEYGNRAICSAADNHGYYNPALYDGVYGRIVVKKHTGANGFAYKDW